MNNIQFTRGRIDFKNHRYLKKIYSDEFPDIVLEKAVQVGATIFMLSQAIWLVIKQDRDVIYFMPDQGWANIISNKRLKEDIILNSPKIKSKMTRTAIDNVKMRKIGKGTIHFRGMISASATQETPVSCVFFDEIDNYKNSGELHQKINEGKNRMLHSDMQWERYASKPTIQEWGIDLLFEESDQRYWNLICPACGKKNIIEETFPNCIKNKDEIYYLACFACGEPLNANNGVWIPKKPELSNEKHGYHLCHLYTPYVKLKKQLEIWQRIIRGVPRSGEDKETFKREILGLPYVNTKNQITTAQVLACCRQFNLDIVPFEYIDVSGNLMGIDTGKDTGKGHHYFIGRKEGMNEEEVYKIFKIGIAHSFDELGKLMKDYQVKCCVIDPGGNASSADKFQEHFGKEKVILCYYNSTNQQLFINHNKDKGQVLANRTRTLDHSGDHIRLQKVWLPHEGICPDVVNFAIQTERLTRIMVTDSNDIRNKKYKYIDKPPTDFRHAWNYIFIAGLLNINVMGNFAEVKEINESKLFDPIIKYDDELGY